MTNGTIPLRGSLAARKLGPATGLLYVLLNLPNVLRGLWRREVATLFGIPTLYATLSARKVTADGRVVEYGIVATRVVTNAFVAALATHLFDGSTTLSSYDFHASGTGTTAEAAADTTLVSDSGVARATGTPTNPAQGQYRSVATQSYTGTLAITEHGLFNASTVGTLMDRSVFAAINVANGDSIQWTYTLTCTAGG